MIQLKFNEKIENQSMKNASKFHKAPPEVSDGLGTLKFGFEFFVP